MPSDRSDPDYRKLIFQEILEETRPSTLMRDSEEETRCRSIDTTPTIGS
jgi:hypothetical protein